MPVGAITVEMTKQGLKNGFMHGWAVGLGGMTIDIVLVFALYMGLASIFYAFNSTTHVDYWSGLFISC